MTVSKTGVVLVIVAFFIILSSMIGAYEQYTYKSIDAIEGDNIDSRLSFFPAIIHGYSDLPTFLNVIIFGVLGSLILWIVVSTFFPTGSGGS